MARRRKNHKKTNQPRKRRGFPVDNASRLDNLKQVNLNAAGIDVGASNHYVAVPEGRDEAHVRCFGAFTADLNAIADWLEFCKIDTVAMESTGVYWIPLFELLERRGFNVKLVQPAKLKNVPGRKTDVLDCQWIQQLQTYGLLEGSFRPKDEICVLRSYMRQREMLVRYASQHIQHMQKALEQMNLKLTEVLGEVTGVTGTRIIRSIIDGERDPEVLAKHRDPRCKNSIETIALALEGNWRDEHIFELRQSFELYRMYHHKLGEIDEQIDRCFQAFEDKSNGKQLKPRSRRRNLGSNEPAFDMRNALNRMIGMDLTEVPGLGGHIVLGIVSEVGTDMSAWRTEGHFTSWLCLCPSNHKTGGKQKRSRTKTRPTTNRAATLFRLAARSVLRTDTALGAFCRRLRARLGPAKAITATAHKIAKIYYNALKHGKQYIDEGASKYEARFRQWAEANLRRRAQQLGFTLTPSK